LESIDHPGWHILITEPRRERTATVGLVAYGMAPYCPELPPRRVKRRGKVVQVIQPLLPGYLLISEGSVNWTRVRMTAGIVASRPFLKNNRGEPAILSHGIFLQLKEIEKLEWEKTRGRKYSVGQKVRVTDRESPWADLVGEVQRLQDRNFVRALLPLFNQSVPVTLTEDQVEAA
jgi:transcription antitermination factor NusG